MKAIVVIAEFSTGIVLNSDGSRYLGRGDYKIRFESISEAKAFALKHIESNPDHECVVLDGRGAELAIFRPPLDPPPIE